MYKPYFPTYLFYLKQIAVKFYLITSNYINMRIIICDIIYFEVSLRHV